MSFAQYIRKVREVVRQTGDEVLAELATTTKSAQDRAKASNAIALLNISVVLAFELDYIRNAKGPDLDELRASSPPRKRQR